MYSNGFLSRGFTHRREILLGGSATSQTGLLLFWEIVSWIAEFWASTGWEAVLLAESLLKHLFQLFSTAVTSAAQLCTLRHSTSWLPMATILQ